MVGKLTFTINGGKQLEQDLLKLGPAVAQKGGDKALTAAARMIVREAKALVPTRTGALKRSITYTTSAEGRGNDERLVLVGFKPPTSRRAHFTEYGTRRSAAKPFMRPVLDARAQDALTIMAEMLALFIQGRGLQSAADTFGDEASVEFIGSE